MRGFTDILAEIQQWVGSQGAEQPILIISDSKEQREKLCMVAKRSAVCETRTACGSCNACKQADANGHPDALTIQGEKNRIRVKDIATLRSILAHTSAKRVVCIPYAEHLLKEASNALLKTFEEPTKNTRFLLCTNSKRSILPTIRSRCNVIAIHSIMQNTEAFNSTELLKRISSLRPPEPFQEGELLEISRLVHQLAIEHGASMSLYMVSLRLRDYHKTASFPGGNTKLAADLLLASLANLRNNVSNVSPPARGGVGGGGRN